MEDADTRVWLFGSVHALPAGVTWLTGPVAQATDTADELVLEIAEPPGDTEAARSFARLAARPPSPVVDRVPLPLRDEMRQAARAIDQPLAALDHMDDWAVAILLSTSAARTARLSRENGVEAVLRARFERDGRPVRALESSEQQFALFDALPPWSQRRFLGRVLMSRAGAGAQLTAAVHAWMRGDVERLAGLTNAELADNPPLRDALLVRRNRIWATWIARRLERPGTVLVAVGAAHLAGAESVQAALAARGITARRVQ